MRTVAVQRVRHGRRRTNWEEELASTLGDLKLTRGIACPCVWQGCIKGEHLVPTVHGDDITIGGELIGGGTRHQNDMKNIRDQKTGDR